jgi:hypothetical protein
MYDNHFVTYEEKAKFYNKIYEPLHPCYDPKTRIYHKALKDNDFEFKDNKLHYGKLNDLNFDRANEVFPGFNDVNNEKNVQICFGCADDRGIASFFRESGGKRAGL